MISLIAAMTKDRVIGKAGKLPWSIPEDLQFFKQTTLGKPVIMGRKTYESIGRPLPGRQNIILTRQADLKIKGCIITTTVDEALSCVEGNPDEIMVIGGAEIYELFLPKAKRLYLSIVDKQVEGDAFFPRFNQQEWTLAKQEDRDGFVVQILDKVS